MATLDCRMRIFEQLTYILSTFQLLVCVTKSAQKFSTLGMVIKRYLQAFAHGELCVFLQLRNNISHYGRRRNPFDYKRLW